MPKRKSTPAPKNEFRGFFNYSLTEGDKSAIRKLSESVGDPHTFFEDLCGFGYKITVSKGSGDDTWFASATGKKGQTPNQNRCLTTRHSILEIALATLHHIIFTVYSEEEWPEEQADDWDW